MIRVPFALSYTLSEGLALVGFTCAGAQVDLAARTITGSLVEDQKLECRLSGQSVAQAVAETVAQIDTFMDARAQAIVANQPARGRRTARLGGGGGLGGIGGAGGTLNFNGQTMPLDRGAGLGGDQSHPHPYEWLFTGGPAFRHSGFGRG